MTSRKKAVVIAAVAFFSGLVIPTGNAGQTLAPVKATQLTGLSSIKDNAKGTLSVQENRLHFVHGKQSSDVSAASIQDVVTGVDTEKAVGKTIGMVSMAAPYGGGRFLSLFRKTIDTLTVQYRDANGGLHGTIFTMPVGAAEVIKEQLVAQGAHTSAPAELNAVPSPSSSSLNFNKEKQ